MTLPNLYTLTDVTDSLGMSERWLRQKCKEGAEHTRLGRKIRFTQEQFNQLVADHVQAKPEPATSITTGRKRRSA